MELSNSPAAFLMLIVPIHYLQIVAGNYILMPQQQNCPGLTIHQRVVWSQLNLRRGGGGVGGSGRRGGASLGGVKMGPMYFKLRMLVNVEEEGGK